MGYLLMRGLWPLSAFRRRKDGMQAYLPCPKAQQAQEALLRAHEFFLEANLQLRVERQYCPQRSAKKID